MCNVKIVCNRDLLCIHVRAHCRLRQCSWIEVMLTYDNNKVDIQGLINQGALHTCSS